MESNGSAEALQENLKADSRRRRIRRSWNSWLLYCWGDFSE